MVAVVGPGWSGGGLLELEKMAAAARVGEGDDHATSARVQRSSSES